MDIPSTRNIPKHNSSTIDFGTDNIQVLVRVRPLLMDIERNARICVVVNEKENRIQIDCQPQPKHFTFDYLLGMNSTQSQVFRMVGQPITDKCLQGYNCTIFCYGQTGSGKTFTIQGRDILDQEKTVLPSSTMITDDRGLTPRIFDYLFSQIMQKKKTANEICIEDDIKIDSNSIGRKDYLVKCSCLEIYNERIQDLINLQRNNLQIRQSKKGVIVEGLTFHSVTNANECLELLYNASMNRRVSETSMNKESSRSHLIFTIVIECKDHTNEDGIIRTRISRFNLVDLAGSERQTRTKISGVERLREAGSINKSLTVLGLVMNALVKQSNRNECTHIHYRDSKLTHLLKDSLGGNSLTFMVANISPAFSNKLESLSTLSFASRAKYIKNRALLNEDESGGIMQLKTRNHSLMDAIRKLKTGECKTDGDLDENNFKKVTEAMQDTLNTLEIENRNIRNKQLFFEEEIKSFSELIGVKNNEILNLRKQLDCCTFDQQLLSTLNMNENDFQSSNINNNEMQINSEEDEELDSNAENEYYVYSSPLQTKYSNNILLENDIRSEYNHDKSALIEERIKNIELQRKISCMTDYIQSFINDGNSMNNEQYVKWKNTYYVLLDENLSLKKSNAQKNIANEKMNETEERLKQMSNEISFLKNKENVLHLEMNEKEQKLIEFEHELFRQQSNHRKEIEILKQKHLQEIENLKSGALKALGSNDIENENLKHELLSEKTKSELIDQQFSNHRYEADVYVAETMKELDEKNEICLDFEQTLLHLNEKVNKYMKENEKYLPIINEKNVEIYRLLKINEDFKVRIAEFEDIKNKLSTADDEIRISNDIKNDLQQNLIEKNNKLKAYENLNIKLNEKYQFLSNVELPEIQQLMKNMKIQSLLKIFIK